MSYEQNCYLNCHELILKQFIEKKLFFIYTYINILKRGKACGKLSLLFWLSCCCG